MRQYSLPVIIAGFFIFLAGPAAGQSKVSGDVDAAKCWTYPTGESTGEGLFQDATGIFVALPNGTIEALTLNGQKAWSTELGGQLASNILVAGSSVLLVTASSSVDASRPSETLLRSLSRETGIPTWTIRLAGGDRHSLHVSNGVLITVSKSGVIQSLNLKDGSMKWKREIAEGFAAEPAFSSSQIAVATTSKQVFRLSLLTGEIESMQRLPFNTTSLGWTPDNALIIGDERGNVALYVNGAQKAYWKFRSGGEISRVDGAAGGVLALSFDNFVYFLSARNGDVVWKKRMSGRVSQAAVYANKYAVVTAIEEHAAVLVDLSTGKIASRITMGEDETAIAIAASAQAIFLLTNAAAYSFSVNGCGGK